MTTLSPMSICEEWLSPTRDTTTSAPLGAQFLVGVKELGIYVVWGPKAVGGVVQIEGAHEEAYTGRWAPLVKVTGTVGHAVDYRAITGVHGAIRARVVDPPIGGDVSVWHVGN